MPYFSGIHRWNFQIKIDKKKYKHVLYISDTISSSLYSMGKQTIANENARGEQEIKDSTVIIENFHVII